MTRLHLRSSGYFSGQFVVTTEDCSFPIGDYLEITLTEQPYATGEKILTPHGVLQLAAFPVTITFSACPREIEAVWKVLGKICWHLYRCLQIGTTQVIVARKYEFGKYIWYYPVVDGQTVGHVRHI